MKSDRFAQLGHDIFPQFDNHIIRTFGHNEKQKRSNSSDAITCYESDSPAEPVHRPPRYEVTRYLYRTGNGKVYEYIASDLTYVLGHSE